MRTMTEIRLGQDGIEYVRSCLRQGSDLCSRILELTLADGEAFAPVPDDVDLNRVKQFDVGGLISRRETVYWLTRHLKHLFQNDLMGTLVFQDVWATPGDVAGVAGGTRRFFHNQNVYYLLGHGDLKEHQISETLRQLRSYLVIAVFAQFQFGAHQIL